MIHDWLVLLGAVAMAFVASPALAADPDGAALNLTAPQQQKLAALESASRTQAGQLIGQIQQVRAKLSDLYQQYNFDANAARRMNQDLNRVQGQLLDLHLSEQQQLRDILSADQFAQLQAEIHRHGFRGGHRADGVDHRHGPHGWPEH